jgi:hypothetical protein
MHPKTLVRISNIIGTVSIILLLYWVFTFISIQVFGFKVFRKNLTETFYMSVLGILALMFGALIINVMFNLTRIAQKHNLDENNYKASTPKKLNWIFAVSFPVLFGLLFIGDYFTSKKKESLLIDAARSIIQDNAKKANRLANYSFTKKWITETGDILSLLSKTDKYFPHVSVITKDSIDNSNVFLGFQRYYGDEQDTTQPLKKNYILQTTKEERDYLNSVFDRGIKATRFSAHDGSYELYYPVFRENKTIVLYFSDYQRYGKMGS